MISRHSIALTKLQRVPKMASNPQANPNTTPDAATNTNPDASHSTISVTQQHEANLLRALETSPHELAYLEKHLLNNNWIPNSADEAAIKDAVFNFLFRAYSDDEEYHDPDNYEDYEVTRDRKLSRETAKYHGVRSLIADIAMRENGGQAS